MKTLYELTIKRGKSFYVIAESPNEAQDELSMLLSKADWWYTKDREITNIKILAKEYHCFPDNHPVFGEDENLIIVENQDKIKP
jgi:uncharacterized protein YneR